MDDATWSHRSCQRGTIKAGRVKQYIVLVMAAALLGTVAFMQTTGLAAAPTRKGSAMMSESTYPTAFASPHQDSHVAASAQASGQLVWSHALDMKSTGGRLDLLSLGNAVLVAQASAFALYSADGTKAWERIKQPGSPLAIGNGLVYFETPGLTLNAVDASGEMRLRNASLPAVQSPEQVLMLLWPRQHDYITAVDLPDARYDLDDDKAAVYDPSINAARSTYGHRTSDWTGDFTGIVALPPLFVPQTHHWLVAQSKVRVTRLDLSTVTSGDTPTRFDIPLDAAQAWSADLTGGLMVLGRSGNAKALVRLDSRGAEAWRWLDQEGTDNWVVTQPPIRGVNGRVFALTDSRVVAIDAGRLTWQFDAGSDALRHGASEGDGSFVVKEGRLLSTFQLAYATALGDGSLLVVGNRTLYQLEADGRIRFQLQLPDTLVSPPSVAADGSIYVASAVRLYKVR